MDCRHCGYRIPTDAPVCPHCHANPRQRRLLSSNLLIVVLFALVLVFMCFLALRTVSTSPTNYAGLGLRPQPSAAIEVIYTIATPLPPEMTLAPNPTFTPTFTPRFSPTPTRKGAATITPTPATPTPKLDDYSAPKLIAPMNGAAFSGADANFSLEWQSASASGLRENEWYQISVSYSARSGGTATQTGWSRETRWSVPKDWWKDLPANARTLTWNIQVMRVEGADPYASPSRAPASPASESRKLVWQ